MGLIPRPFWRNKYKGIPFSIARPLCGGVVHFMEYLDKLLI